MSGKERLPLLPWVLLGALSLVSIGGPFAILVVVWGGASALWPPDRPLEWITIALVFALFMVLFLACVTFGWWHPPPHRRREPHER